MAKRGFLLCTLVALLLIGCGSPKIEKAVEGVTAERGIEFAIEVLTAPQRIIEGAFKGMIEGLELSQYTHYQTPR